jgi:hypothetical protein
VSSSESQSTRPSGRGALGHDEIRRIAGDVGDARIAAIMATGASTEELEEAVAWAAGESDVMGEARLPLSGVVARLYDILVQDEDVWGDEDRPAAG